MNGSLTSVKTTQMQQQSVYDITALVYDDILEIIVTGDITDSDTRKRLMQEIIYVEKSTNTKKQLLDVQKLKGRLETLEIYNFVRDYPPDRPRMKIALLDTKEHAEAASFHETTALNAGLIFKWFTDINDAKTWLKSM